MAKPSVHQVAKAALESSKSSQTSRNESMPYVLHKAENYFPNDPSKIGHFLLVNRGYNPISSTVPGDDPGVLRLSVRPEYKHRFVSYALYDDGCCPQYSAKDLKAYKDRLRTIVG